MDLFFRKYGSGPPLIIVHGLYGSSDNWVTVGKALAKRFEVFIVDQRNHGRSPHSEHHNYDLMRDDLLEFMDKQSIGKALLLGHSMGGKTIMFFAASYPERVNGLIVVDIAPKSYFSYSGESVQSADHLFIIRAMENMDLSEVSNREEADRELSSRITSDRVRQFLLKNLSRSKTGTFRWKLNLEVIRKDLVRILEGLNASEFERGNQITGFPILFIRGANSTYILDSDIPSIRKIFPYAEFTTIPGAGHWLHAEQPELLVEEVNGFVFGEREE
jgi:esterase